MENHWMAQVPQAALMVASLCATSISFIVADDWPMLGRDGTRNSVSLETGAPNFWSVANYNKDPVARESHGIRWSAPLGSETHSSPVVSDGLVWIGTNNPQSGVQAGESQHSVLKCFRVADGKQVYEYVSPKLGTRIQDAGWTGLGSSPLIEGDRLWLTTNRSEVLCWDIGPLIRGEGTPRELWKLDLIKTFDTFPHVPLMGPARPCSIGASWNDRIFVTTNNGVGNDWISVPKPDAANLVCLNKNTGEVYWKDSSPGANILLTQLSSPTVATIRGQVQVIVPQSDGWVRAFDPMTGEKHWEFDMNAKESIMRLAGPSRTSLLGNAVVVEDRVYIASGMDAVQGNGPGRLVCIDPTKRGDVSAELAVNAEGHKLPHRRKQAVDTKVGEKAIANPNSALVWEFSKCGNEFEDEMHLTLGSVAIAKGLVIAVDFEGLMHCLDAKTGQRHWSYDTLSAIWASPLIVDDKVYIADEDGEVAIFGLSADPNVACRRSNGQIQPLVEIPMGNYIVSSPAFANGVLYIARRNRLFAIEGDKSHVDSDLTSGYWPQWRGPKRDNVSSEVPAKIGEGTDATKSRTLRSVFVPTPHDIVDKMLEIAKVKKTDVVYDLGSGDGRIVISVAQKFGCRAIGFELDEELVTASRAKAEAAGVKSLVNFELQDLFTADLRNADVIAVYLLPQQLEKLIPQLEKMKPGSRVISHQFEIPGVPPDKVEVINSTEDGAKHTLYLWTSPLKKAIQ